MFVAVAVSVAANIMAVAAVVVVMYIEVATDWTEASVKVCFSLFVSLLPLNHRLLRE